jgi:hypothetical protein
MSVAQHSSFPDHESRILPAEYELRAGEQHKGGLCFPVRFPSSSNYSHSAQQTNLPDSIPIHQQLE